MQPPSCWLGDIFNPLPNPCHSQSYPTRYMLIVAKPKKAHAAPYADPARTIGLLSSLRSLCYPTQALCPASALTRGLKALVYPVKAQLGEEDSRGGGFFLKFYNTV